MMNTESQKTFAVFEILAEAWDKTKGFKRSFWAAILMTLLALIGYLIVTSIPIALFQAANADKTAISVMDGIQTLLQQFVTAPIIAGFYIMAIKRASDKPVHWKMAFSQFKYFIKFGFAYIARILIIVAVIAIPTLIGAAIIAFMPNAMAGKLIYALLILVAIILALYLIVAYIAMMPLIADRGLGIWQALETSRRTISKHWFKTLGLIAMLGLLFIASLFTLGILLIWIIPMSYAAYGIFYRELFSSVR